MNFDDFLFDSIICLDHRYLKDIHARIILIYCSTSKYRKSSVKPPSLPSPLSNKPLPQCQNLKYPPPSLLRIPHLYKILGNLPNIFRLFSCTTLHINFSMIWDKNCIEFLYLSRKIVCLIRKIWNKGIEKLPNISFSLDFVNKPPSLISSPL